MRYVMLVLALMLAGCGEGKKLTANLEKTTTECSDGLVWRVTPYGKFGIFNKDGSRMEC